MDTVAPRHSPLQEQMLRHPHLAEAVDAVHGHPVLQPGRQADAPVPKGSVKVEPLVGGGGVYGVLRAGVGQRIGAACIRHGAGLAAVGQQPQAVAGQVGRGGQLAGHRRHLAANALGG